MPKLANGIIIDKGIIKGFIHANDLPEDSTFETSPIWKSCFSGWKYKLRLGNEVYISTDEAPKKLKEGEFITIKPGDFALLLSKESIFLTKDVMAFISMRFDYKQKGLINVSGFHVDPWYEGKLIFAAFNAGPRDIVLRESDPVFMIFFQKISREIPKEKASKGYDFIPAEMVEQIRGRSATLSSNATRLDKLEFHTKLIGGVSVATLTLLIGLALREILK